MARKTSKTTRMKHLMRNIPKDKTIQAAKLAEELIFMEDKLENARQLIGNTGVAISYNNGGGQTGIRENPALIAYQKLMKTYLSTMRELDAMREEQQTTSAMPAWLV